MVLWERLTGWSLELTRFHRLNVVICKVLRGMFKTPVIRAYLPPTTMAYLPDLEEDLECCRFQDPIFMEDLNVDLDYAQNLRSQLVADMLVEFGLINLMHHFQQMRRFCHLKTWT